MLSFFSSRKIKDFLIHKTTILSSSKIFFYHVLNQMAWGIFNKIKRGIKKAFNFVKDKIVKPVVKVAEKVAPVVTPIMDTIIPGSGRIAQKVVSGASAALKGDVGDVVNALRSGKIRLK